MTKKAKKSVGRPPKEPTMLVSFRLAESVYKRLAAEAKTKRDATGSQMSASEHARQILLSKLLK